MRFNYYKYAMSSELSTAFAPAERSTRQELQQQFALIHDLPQVVRFLDALPTLAMVLNRHRQIVFANAAFLQLVNRQDTGELSGQRHGEVLECIRVAMRGQRPGEAVDCIHATQTAAGCGTTVFCRTCGAVLAILNSQSGVEDVQECRLQRQVNRHVEALDLRVWARPLDVGGEPFTLVTLADISNEKRRQTLERIFFHDILNTAGGVQGLAQILRDAKDEEEVHELSALLWTTSEQLIGEINAQRLLTAAENNDLVVKPVEINLQFLLADIAAAFRSHPVAQDRTLQVTSEVQEVLVRTDATLLRRVVINLVKNALEASAAGEAVTLKVVAIPEGAVITIHNPAIMPEDIRLQIFNRSFSTRGPGRGLGTYSAKLLTERYLGGRITFDSAVPRGTTFRVILPRAI